MTLQGQRTPLSFPLSVCVRFPFHSIFSVLILFYGINDNNNNNNNSNNNNNNNTFIYLIIIIIIPSYTPYLHLTSTKAGGVAENDATRKEDKYVDLQQTYTFILLAFETLGPINVKGVEFLQELGRRLAAISDDNRQTSFLFQRISITLQRLNAITFADTFA